jgi:hypothetical protein
MSELRKHIDIARGAYQSTRYPGDLASQVLPVRRNLWPRIIGSVIASAAAAIIVVILLNQSLVQTAPRIDIVPATQDTNLVTLPGIPEMPQAVTLSTTLDQPIFLPSLPTFPSLSDITLEANQSNTTNQIPTTQESL